MSAVGTDQGAGVPTPRGLVCRECKEPYDHGPIHVCEMCFGPLEVDYDYEAIGRVLTRARIAERPNTMWRYAELLPLSAPPTVGLEVGGTPLIRADRLARELGVGEAWVKTDGVCHPSLSFKDRVVSVALSKAREIGFDTVGCASTGNLAGSVAANAASAGLRAYIFVPSTLERAKIVGTQVYGPRIVAIDGTYDEVNRLCAEIGDKYSWGFANVNLRPYYAEGSKSLAFEVAESLGWRTPDHVVTPMAGGSLICKIQKAWTELEKVGLLEEPSRARIHGAQAAGCAPIASAALEGRELIRPVREPDTIAHSLAIGNPADGFYAVRTMRETGGSAAAVSDDEIVNSMRLLAETEGIFTETAGGVTVAAARRLIERGEIGRGDSVVICSTGQGLKTMDSLVERLPPPRVIAPKLAAFDELERALSPYTKRG